MLKRFTFILKCYKTHYSTNVLQHVKKATERKYIQSRIRNTGIIAHIDAGKTTTTERMLFYSGSNSSPGNIDDGNTVTDFLKQERERGISITSAVVSFVWNDHLINLVDTPGHIDFTSEVECSLRVLDSAVLLLDASAGVEAQTMMVWRQARKNVIPQVVFVNKMDKKGANLQGCVESINKKLASRTLVLQKPLYSEDGVVESFVGVVDLVGMKKYLWTKGGSFGADFMVEEVEGKLLEECLKERVVLLEELADLDEVMGEKYLEGEDLGKMSEEEVWKAVARVTQSCKALPVLCGSSLRNKGVQPLLNAIVSLLPDPLHHNVLQTSDSAHKLPQQSTVAFAFKTMHMRNREPITFLRLHSGHLNKSSTELYNHTSQCNEKIDKLLQIRADEYKELSQVSSGMIFAVSGLKQTKTGDILVSPEEANNPVLDEIPLINVPQPVFFCSIEPPSLALQAPLDQALECLCREDPSLKVRVDGTTGQTVLGGMGRLHLEVVRDRVKQEYNIDADLGPLQIAYQETIKAQKTVSHQIEKVLGGNKQFVNAKCTFYPVQSGSKLVDSTSGRDSRAMVVLSGGKKHKSTFTVRANVETDLWKYGLKLPHLRPIQDGLHAGFSKGHLMGFPVCGVHAEVNDLQMSSRVSLPLLSSCFSTLASMALQHNSTLLQPIMHLEVLTTEDMLGVVLSDLSQRQAHIEETQRVAEGASVVARAPLKNLNDFSTLLRTKTRGLASFNMALSHYEQVDDSHQS